MSNDMLVLKDGTRIHSIDPTEVIWIEAAGNYVQIHARTRQLLIRHTLKGMAAKLRDRGFLRIRPSAIIRIAEVQSVEPRPGGDYRVTLTDGNVVASSRRYREAVQSRLAYHLTVRAPGRGSAVVHPSM